MADRLHITLTPGEAAFVERCRALSPDARAALVRALDRAIAGMPFEHSAAICERELRMIRGGQGA
jgi:hypothetical protein